MVDTDPRTVLVTPRLLLRRWDVDEDLLPYWKVCRDPEVMRYIRDGRTLTLAATRDQIATFAGEWTERGFGLCAAVLRETGRLIGFIGLSVPLFLPEELPAVEIGWRLRRDTWGRGLATEGAREVLRYGFDVLGLDRVVSIRHVDNLASGRVMEKIGLQFDHFARHPGSEQDLSVHAATRSSVTP